MLRSVTHAATSGMVQQGRTRNAEKEPDFKADLMAPVGGQVKVGPPPNRKLSGTIDVIGGEPGTIRRVEGRRRDKNGPEENSIQVLGDNGSKAHPTKSLQQPGPQQPLVPPMGPPPVGGSPPSCFFLPWMPVTSSPPLRHHLGMPPPAPVPGLLPPPHASPPPLSILTHDGQSASYNNSQRPSFGYNSTASGFISYPPISTSHMPWMTTASNISKSSHWEHSGSRGERDCDWTSATSEYNDDERDHYYSREGNSNFEQDYHSRDNSWEREYHHWEQRHRNKEEAVKHKSWCDDERDRYCSQECSYDFVWDYHSREQEDHHQEQSKQHESKEGGSHRRHKHKTNKHNKRREGMRKVYQREMDTIP